MERHDAKTAKALGEPDEELDGTAREVVGSLTFQGTASSVAEP
jgi:hypothetical protein